MTTLRRALRGLYRRESILALATLLTLAMLFASQPALAMSHGGGGGGGHSGGGGGGHAGGGGGHSGGGGGGHMGGGGGHSGGGGHMSGGSGGSGGRYGGGTAHPVGPGERVFGPNRGFHDGFRGGRDHDGRFFRDRDDFFFGGGYYPWFGFGLGLGLGFGWDYPWGWGPGFYGYWGPSWSGYNPGYGPGYGYYPGYGYGGEYSDGYGSGSSSPAPRSRGEMGALNIDVSPSDTEVYLNGEYIGRARDFSGWGRGYLWLEKGTYDIVFYKDGYRTLARQLSIYPGLVIKWDDKLEHGQAVRPEDLPTKSHERRDSRLQFERDRADRIDRQQRMQEPPPYQGQQGPQAPEDNSGGWSDNWRDRVNHDRNGNAPQRNLQPAPAPGPARAAVTSDQYGRLRVKVEPDDASVYLDGRFVGTGSDLAGNEAGLLLAPGHHRLSVVRPGHRAEERELDAVLGKDIDLSVSLSPSAPTGR